MHVLVLNNSNASDHLLHVRHKGEKSGDLFSEISTRFRLMISKFLILSLHHISV